MPSKDAEAFLDDLVQAVQPPPLIAIVLRERTPKDETDTNWVTAVGVLPMDALTRYDSAIVELRRRHPRIDWDGVTERSGEWRRISRWL